MDPLKEESEHVNRINAANQWRDDENDEDD